MTLLRLTLAAGLALAAASPAAACSYEVGNSWYIVSPTYDDGLSNATRVDCPEIGTLSTRKLGSANPMGVYEMLDPNGNHMLVRDFAAITAVAEQSNREFEFSVVITADYYVGFRFGDSSSETFFGEGPGWVGWYAVDDRNNYVQALRIASVDTNMDGEIAVSLLVNREGLVCTLTSSSELNFGTTWDCAHG